MGEISLSDDERTLKRGDRLIGYLGPRASSFTLAWLATHRDRLRTLILGGKRLSVLVVYDTLGQTRVEHSDEEVAALREILCPPVRAERWDTDGKGPYGF